MDQLTSCYFCGDAVDAAVEEYPLVRSRAFPDVDTDRRVYLCPSCRRKLTQVIEHVLEAAFDGSEEGTDAPGADRLRDVEMDGPMDATEVEAVAEEPQPSTAADESRDSAVADGDTAANGDAAADDPTETAHEEAGAADPAESPASGQTEAAAGEDAAAQSGEDGETEASEWGIDGAESAATAESATDAGDQARTDEAVSGDESADAGDDAVESIGSAAAASESGREADTQSGQTGGDQSGQAGQQSAGDAGDSDDGAADSDDEERQYTKSEFNKVVRLLQNREFPVGIDELVVVAGSAYEIDEPTCHAIIDALIERGVVADNGEELVRA